MSNLTCDICEGKITIRSGGIAVCEVCGMEHSKERLLEKTQELRTQSTSLVTSSSLPAQSNINQTNIATWLEMAMNAQASSNNAEAEAYATRILEVDPEHWHAWMIKGQSAGWQSTLNNLRIQETAQCFSKCLERLPADRKTELTNSLLIDLESLGLAIVQLRAKHFIDYPVEVREFKTNVIDVISSIELFTSTYSLEIPQLKNKIATVIHNACIASWNGKITPDYWGKDNRPGRYAFSTYIDHTDNCIYMIEFAIALKELSMDDKISLDNLIRMQDSCCNACSYTLRYSQYGSFYEKDYTLTDVAINGRKLRIKKYQETIQHILTVEEKRRIAQDEIAEKFRIEQNNEFWLTYKTQKEELTQELDKLHSLYTQAKADRTTKEQLFIQTRINSIAQILAANYTPDDQLPTSAIEILAAQQEWHTKHAQIRESNYAETQARMRERDSIRKQIAEQDVIIAQNPGFFGEPARIRKQANQTKATLQSQLSTYNDLG